MSTAGDGRFFARTGPHPVRAVAALLGIAPPEPADRLLHGVAPLQLATPEQVSFLDNRRYAAALAATAAGAVIVHPTMAAKVPEGAVALVTPEPYLAWARVASLFHPEPPARPGVHPSSSIDATARIDPSAELGPLCVIGARAEVGARCRIGAGAVIGDGVVLGEDCRIGANASVSHALLGARVYVYPGARIGQEGFGFAITPTGFVTVPQLGRVIVEDDVEIGANSTVDRGSATDTVIGAGSRIDNLVQIAHNVRLGRCCVIAAQAGISGSTVLEDFVMIGGQVGIVGHVRIGKAARIAAQSGVMSDVAPRNEVMGSPAMPMREYFRNVAVLRRLAARRPPRTEGAQTEDVAPNPSATGDAAGPTRSR